MKIKTTFRDWRKGSLGREISGAENIFVRKDQIPVTYEMWRRKNTPDPTQREVTISKLVNETDFNQNNK